MRSWQATAAEMIVLGVVIAFLTRRGDTLGVVVGSTTVAGGVLTWAIGRMRFRESEPGATVLDARAASVLLVALIVVVAIAIGAHAWVA